MARRTADGSRQGNAALALNDGSDESWALRSVTAPDRRMLGRGQCPVTARRLLFWRKFESSTAMSIQTVHLPPTSTLTATPSFPTAHSAYRRNKRPFQAQGRLRCLSPASEAYRRNKRRLQFGVVRGTRLYLPNTPSMKRIDFSVSHFDGDLVTVIGIARALPP